MCIRKIQEKHQSISLYLCINYIYPFNINIKNMSHVLYIDVDYYNVLFLMFVLWLVIILIRTTTVREDPRKAPTRKRYRYM